VPDFEISTGKLDKSYGDFLTESLTFDIDIAIWYQSDS